MVENLYPWGSMFGTVGCHMTHLEMMTLIWWIKTSIKEGGKEEVWKTGRKERKQQKISEGISHSKYTQEVLFYFSVSIYLHTNPNMWTEWLCKVDLQLWVTVEKHCPNKFKSSC